ncbi:PHP domain-containing protein [Dysgonomonas sp. GY75]|uniref:PHP domain-containing protein n=1 Tax=Dysgonomonas sp. GY75 TaxID=2780419 RepID=UPI0018F006F1|nr:PHP domain-containing protein [Dysgonomonas sp. GY75]
MNELIQWLQANKICYVPIDSEVIEITGFGRLFVADLSEVQSIFRGTKDNLIFNLMENPQVLIEEGINYVAFPFGQNWYYYDLREEFRFNILKYIGNREKPVLDIPFVNLGVHTPYELLNGSGDIGQWIKKAKALGHSALGICDYNTMAATLTFQKECTKAGIKPVFGYSFTVAHPDEKVEMKVYCQNNRGLKNLLRLHKTIMVDSEDNTISIQDLLKYAGGNVLVFGKLSSFWMDANLHLLVMLKQAFEKLYYQIDLSEYKAERIDVKILRATQYFFERFYVQDTGSFRVEPILLCDNYYIDKDEAINKIILNKIASGAAHEQSNDQYFKDIDEHYATLSSVFSSEKWNIENLLQRMCSHTIDIANNAEARYEMGSMYMPRYIMLDNEIKKYGDRHAMFLQLLEEGLNRKIPAEDHDRYRKRLEEEIYIIESTNNVDYFLIQWDMIREAKRRGIATGVGRGSAGGSLVSYLLGIITIDPLKYDLIFSRFLVPERCGLNWVENITKMQPDTSVGPAESYVELNIGGKTLLFFRDAEFRIIRDEKEATVYADELIAGDEILFDNKDLLWTLNELEA